MDRSAVDVDVDTAKLEALVDRFEAAPIRLALLFGSSATGEATSESDVDVAVAYDETAADVTDTHLSLVADITRILGRDDVDVVRLTSVDPRIAADALDEGLLLVGTSDERTALREALEEKRRERAETVRERIADAERAIEGRIGR